MQPAAAPLAAAPLLGILGPIAVGVAVGALLLWALADETPAAPVPAAPSPAKPEPPAPPILADPPAPENA